VNAVRFAVAGDWHGDLSIARAVVRTLKSEDVHLLLHVGDLAVRWPGPKKGRFDKRLGQLLDDADIEFLFIDGNHDNHKELRELTLLPDGTRRLSDRMSYMPRGTVIERHGVAQLAKVDGERRRKAAASLRVIHMTAGIESFGEGFMLVSMRATAPRVLHS
jgi:predicted phosphodiesterase